MSKMNHADRGDEKPLEVGDRQDHIDLLKLNGWFEVEPDGKPKDQ